MNTPLRVDMPASELTPAELGAVVARLLKMRLVANDEADYVGSLFDIDDVDGASFLFGRSGPFGPSGRSALSAIPALPSFGSSLRGETVAALAAVRDFLIPIFADGTLVYFKSGDNAGRVAVVTATMTNKLCVVRICGPLAETAYVSELYLARLAVGDTVAQVDDEVRRVGSIVDGPYGPYGLHGPHGLRVVFTETIEVASLRPDVVQLGMRRIIALQSRGRAKRSGDSGRIFTKLFDLGYCARSKDKSLADCSEKAL